VRRQHETERRFDPCDTTPGPYRLRPAGAIEKKRARIRCLSVTPWAAHPATAPSPPADRVRAPYALSAAYHTW